MRFEYKKTIFVSNLEDELNVVSEKIKKLNLPKGFFELVVYTISELFANVKEHAKTDKALVVLKINKKKSSIGVTDKGIGLKQSYLSKKIYVKDDSVAIEFALSGLSTKDPGERGFGLYSIRRFVEELSGQMAMKSGRAGALIEKNKINFQHLKKKFPGLNVEIEVPTKKIDFYKIIA